MRSLSTVLGLNDGEYQSTTPARKNQAPINAEEEFFLQQLRELNIRDIQPRFTPQGIEFEALACLQTYYEPSEMIKLLESLTDKGVLEKINYGTVGLCPGCSSPVLMLTLACPRCGSLKVSKRELVKHVECGHSGYSDEFVDGIHYVCPGCGAQAKISREDEEEGDQFKVSDSLYECEDCRSISAKALTSFNCIKCKTRFSSKDIRYENPCGYRLIETNLATPEQAQEQPQIEEESPAEPDQLTDLENQEIVEATSEETASTEEENQVYVTEKPQEPEIIIPPTPEPEENISPDDEEASVDEEPEEEPQEPVEKPEQPKETEKRGFLGRILSKKEEPQAATPKPLKVEKEVVKRSDATILLIEQDQYRADRIIKSLERTRLQSIEVKHAPSGRLGLRELRQPYDAVILDMSLSDMNPDQIVREISRWRVTTPLIVITDDEASAKILSRVDLVQVKLLEYSEAAVRQLPGIIERLIN